MKDINKKIVKVEVSDYDSDFFRTTLTASFIHKSECTVVEEPKEWIPQVGEWAKVVDLEVKGDNLARHYYNQDEVFKIDGMIPSGEHIWLWKEKGKECSLGACRKALPHEIPASEPKSRTPIEVYEGVEIFEDTVSWYIDLDDLEVYECKYPEYDIEDLKSESESYTKNILTPEAVNARLKEIVEQKAKDKTFTLAELKEFDKYEYTAIGYAIELVEKEYNVKYL